MRKIYEYLASMSQYVNEHCTCGMHVFTVVSSSIDANVRSQKMALERLSLLDKIGIWRTNA